MPSDEIRPWNPKFRKRKKHQGAVWAPQDATGVLKQDGAYCPTCRKRHGYMNGLNISYEKRGGHWHVLWSCKLSGTLCEDMSLERWTKKGSTE